ncbi:MAG: hypothetical protein CBB71_16215 [Rhodopirellula sp. TMED11]|nr:MAG: hypothetical protein CBB71_16215 [Rhodopirellula sp. TMED11]
MVIAWRSLCTSTNQKTSNNRDSADAELAVFLFTQPPTTLAILRQLTGPATSLGSQHVHKH